LGYIRAAWVREVVSRLWSCGVCMATGATLDEFLWFDSRCVMGIHARDHITLVNNITGGTVWFAGILIGTSNASGPWKV
jgi:hypothetical protein